MFRRFFTRSTIKGRSKSGGYQSRTRSRSTSSSSSSRTRTATPHAVTDTAQYNNKLELTQDQIDDLVKYYEATNAKLKPNDIEGFKNKFRQLRIMKPAAFMKTRGFYELRKRSARDEIYAQAKARIDNFKGFGIPI